MQMILPHILMEAFPRCICSQHLCTIVNLTPITRWPLLKLQILPLMRQLTNLAGNAWRVFDPFVYYRSRTNYETPLGTGHCPQACLRSLAMPVRRSLGAYRHLWNMVIGEQPTHSSLARFISSVEHVTAAHVWAPDIKGNGHTYHIVQPTPSQTHPHTLWIILTTVGCSKYDASISMTADVALSFLTHTIDPSQCEAGKWVTAPYPFVFCRGLSCQHQPLSDGTGG